MTADTATRTTEPLVPRTAHARQRIGGWAIWCSLVWKDLLSARYLLAVLFLWHLLWAADWIGAWAWKLPDGGAHQTLVWVEKYRLHVSLVLLAFASASVFLADRRRSPTAFWRTRPPAPLRVVASKLIVLGSVGCLWPGLSTFAVFAFTGIDSADAATLGAATFFTHALVATFVSSLAWVAGSWSRLGLIVLGLVVARFIPLLGLPWRMTVDPLAYFAFITPYPWTYSVWLCVCLFLQTRWTRKWPAVVCLLLTGPASQLGLWTTGGYASSREKIAKALPPAPWSVAVGAGAGSNYSGQTYSLTCDRLPAPTEGFLLAANGTGSLGRRSASWGMPTALQRTEHAKTVVSRQMQFSGRWFAASGTEDWTSLGFFSEWERAKAQITAPPQRISGNFISQWARLKVVASGTLSEQPLFLQTSRTRVRLETGPGPANTNSEVRMETWVAPAPDPRHQILFPATNEIVMAIIHPTDGWGCIATRHGGGHQGLPTSSEGRLTDSFHIAEPVTYPKRPESGVFSGGRQYRSALGATVYLLETVPAGPMELCTFDLPIPAPGPQ